MTGLIFLVIFLIGVSLIWIDGYMNPVDDYGNPYKDKDVN